MFQKDEESLRRIEQVFLWTNEALEREKGIYMIISVRNLAQLIAVKHLITSVLFIRKPSPVNIDYRWNWLRSYFVREA